MKRKEERAAAAEERDAAVAKLNAELHALRDELSGAQSKASDMERAFAAQEKEVRGGLEQINTLRGDKEAADAEVARLAARLAAFEASAKEQEAALRGDVASLTASLGAKDAELAAALKAVEASDATAALAAEGARNKLEEIRALEVKLADAESKAKSMERAFSVQEFEVREGIEQVNIMRGEREAAEAEVERLTAQLAAGTSNHTALKGRTFNTSYNILFFVFASIAAYVRPYKGARVHHNHS